MSLWNNTDILASRPTWVNLAEHPVGTQIVFVDDIEADTATNRSKGFNGPGWYLYREYTDSDGTVRYKSECLVALSVPAVISGDAADDLIVPDNNVTVAITVHPTNQTTVNGAATFTVTANLTPAGTLTYQWQRRVPNGNWAVISGATAASLELTAQTVANTGTQFRVVVGGAGARVVKSNPATLTFGT